MTRSKTKTRRTKGFALFVQSSLFLLWSQIYGVDWLQCFVESQWEMLRPKAAHAPKATFEKRTEAHPRLWRQTDCALWKSRWRIHLFGRVDSRYRWETSIHLDGFIKTEYPITRIFNRSDSHWPRTSPRSRYVFGVDVQLRTQFFRGKHRTPQISSKGFIKQFWSYITKC